RDRIARFKDGAASELRDGCLVRVRSLRSEERDRGRPLHGAARRDDLAEDRFYRVVAQRPAVGLADRAQNLLLAPGIEHAARADRLRLANGLGKLGALGHEREQPPVDVVDCRSQLRQTFFLRSQVAFLSGDGRNSGGLASHDGGVAAVNSGDDRNAAVQPDDDRTAVVDVRACSHQEKKALARSTAFPVRCEAIEAGTLTVFICPRSHVRWRLAYWTVARAIASARSERASFPSRHSAAWR